MNQQLVEGRADGRTTEWVQRWQPYIVQAGIEYTGENDGITVITAPYSVAGEIS